MLEKIKNNWQILTALLLLWSFFDIYTYFNQYGIQIQQYLSATELLLLVLPTILKGIFWLFIIMGVNLWFEVRKASATNSKLQIFIYSSNLPEIKRKFQEKKYRSWLFTIFRFILVCIILIGPIIAGCTLLFIIYFGNINYFFPITYSNKPFALVFVGLFVIVILGYISKILDKNKNELVRFFSAESISFAYYLLILLLTSIASNRIDYRLTRNGVGKHQVSFIADGKSFRTSDRIIYVGFTQTYWFFRNNADSSNLIFKMADIKNIIVK